MFADIMLPLEGMGVQFEIKEGIGPVIKHPVRNSQSASALRDLDPKADVPFVLSAIQLTKERLDGQRASDRLLRCTIHISQLPHRGKAQPGFLQH